MSNFTGRLGATNSQLGQIELGSSSYDPSFDQGFSGNAFPSVGTPAFQADAVQTDAFQTEAAPASFSADAVIKGPISSSLTADAVLKRNMTGSFAADAVFIPGPAFVAHRGSNAEDVGSANFSITLTSGASIRVGNFLVGIVSGDNGNRVLNSVTDTAGNTWTVDVQVGSASNGHTAHIASAHVTHAYTNTDVVTFHFNAGQGWGGYIEEFSGVAATNIVDVTGSADNGANQFFWTASTSSATTNNVDLVVGAKIYNTGATATTDTGAYQVSTPLNSLNYNFFNGAKSIVSAYRGTDTTGTYTYSGTYNGGRNTSTVIVAYRSTVLTTTASLTGDAVLKKIQSVSLTANTVLKKTQSASFSADANLQTRHFTADAFLILGSSRDLVRFPLDGSQVWYSASSEFNLNYNAANAANGNRDTHSGAAGISWAESSNVLGWWRVDFSAAQLMDQIILYDRSTDSGDLFGTQGTITFSDGSVVNWSGMSTSNPIIVVDFSLRAITWFRVDATAGSNGFPGLAEVEAYNTLNDFSLPTTSIVNSQSATVTVGRPSGTAQGDFLVAQISTHGPGVSTAPSGWSLLDSRFASSDSSTSFVLQAIYYVIAGPSEPSSYSWTLSSSDKFVAAISRYPGGYTTITEWSAQATNNATSIVAPSITSPTDRLVVMYAASHASGTVPTVGSQPNQGWDDITNWTEQRNSQTTGALASTNVNHGMSHRTWSGGATGTVTAVQTAGTETAGMVIHLIALGRRFFVADAVIRRGQSASFTADAKIIGPPVTHSASFVADAIFLRHRGLTVDDTIFWLADSVIVTPNLHFASFSVDAVLVGGSLVTHDRTLYHSGTDRDFQHVLSMALGKYLRGTTATEFLIDLDARITAIEGGALYHDRKFTADAVIT